MLKEMRQRRKETQAQVAEAIGIARSTLATFEAARDVPGRDTLAAIATYYSIGLTELWPSGGAARAPGIPHFVDDPDELALLDFWRDLDDVERGLLLRMMRPDVAKAA